MSGSVKGAMVKGTVTVVEARQATVDLGDGVIGLKASDLSRDRVEDARNVRMLVTKLRQKSQMLIERPVRFRCLSVQWKRLMRKKQCAT